jgi:hypothetical protein
MGRSEENEVRKRYFAVVTFQKFLTLSITHIFLNRVFTFFLPQMLTKTCRHCEARSNLPRF